MLPEGKFKFGVDVWAIPLFPENEGKPVYGKLIEDEDFVNCLVVEDEEGVRHAVFEEDLYETRQEAWEEYLLYRIEQLEDRLEKHNL